MRTNIVIDDQLIEEAMRVSKAKTKKDLINFALEEYISNHKKKNLMDLKGKIEFDEKYDYKSMREGK
jgi:Arc/MetJ family transcription regulator